MGSMIRTRWAALGAAVAVSVGAGGIGLVGATISDGERAVLVTIEPCRLLDTRPGSQVGPRPAPIGGGEVYEVEALGVSGECDVDTDASGLALNVTALNATAPTFVGIFPADADGVPEVSNLNTGPGQPPTPNSVTTKLSDDGEFSIYNAFGNVDIIVDIAGYYEDHDHDDRYLRRGEIEMTHAPGDWVPDGIIYPPTAFNHLPTQAKVDGSGNVMMPLTGPASFGSGATDYVPTAVTYCVKNLAAGGFVERVTAYATGVGASGSIEDPTDRVVAGCYELDLSVGDLDGSSYVLVVELGGAGIAILETATSTWSPVAG